MLYIGIVCLFTYAMTFILVYLLNTTYYKAGLTLFGLALMEISQTGSGIVFYFVLQNVNSNLHKNLKAIYIVNKSLT